MLANNTIQRYVIAPDVLQVGLNNIVPNYPKMKYLFTRDKRKIIKDILQKDQSLFVEEIVVDPSNTNENLDQVGKMEKNLLFGYLKAMKKQGGTTSSSSYVPGHNLANVGSSPGSYSVSAVPAQNLPMNLPGPVSSYPPNSNTSQVLPYLNSPSMQNVPAFGMDSVNQPTPPIQRVNPPINLTKPNPAPVPNPVVNPAQGAANTGLPFNWASNTEPKITKPQDQHATFTSFGMSSIAADMLKNQNSQPNTSPQRPREQPPPSREPSQETSTVKIPNSPTLYLEIEGKKQSYAVIPNLTFGLLKSKLPDPDYDLVYGNFVLAEEENVAEWIKNHSGEIRSESLTIQTRKKMM